MRNSSMSVGSIAKPIMLTSLFISVGFLSGCDLAYGQATSHCKQEIRQRMRDPSGVQIRHLDHEETSTDVFRIRYSVRGQNGFGAQTEEVWGCRFELFERDDGESYGGPLNASI